MAIISATLVTEGILLSQGRAISDLRQAVKRQLTLGAEFTTSEMRLATPVGATNYARDSWDFKYDDQDQEATIGPRAEYVKVLEFGRRPGKGIPIVPLKLWVVRKAGVTDERAATSMAYAISRKAKKYGIAPKPFVGPTFITILPALNNTFISPIGALVVKALGG